MKNEWNFKGFVGKNEENGDSWIEISNDWGSEELERSTFSRKSEQKERESDKRGLECLPDVVLLLVQRVERVWRAPGHFLCSFIAIAPSHDQIKSLRAWKSVSFLFFCPFLFILSLFLSLSALFPSLHNRHFFRFSLLLGSAVIRHFLCSKQWILPFPPRSFPRFIHEMNQKYGWLELKSSCLTSSWWDLLLFTSIQRFPYSENDE